MTSNITADAVYTMGVADAHVDLAGKNSFVLVDEDNAIGEHINEPTDAERHTLRRISGNIPTIAYLLCIVEFCERASYYGVQPLIGNFVNRPLPKDGNGYGAPERGTQQTAGALGMGSVKSTAVSQSFSMLVYALPVVFGWLSDTRTGRYKMIMWGVLVCGVAHVLMTGSAAKSLLADGSAKAPYFISLYMLAIGAAMFKPCISPTLLDQMKDTTLTTKTLASGEKVIVDPEATTERVMLWFYLLINIGGFMNVATAYCAKYVGWWLAFLIPLILYLPLPVMLWWLKGKIILHPPGGSDLTNVFKALGICLKRGGIKRIFRKGFFDVAKPTNIAASGEHIDVPWNDAFCDDVGRAFQATGIFLFFPIQSINDNGLGLAANTMTAMLTTNGVPNDVIGNFNSLCIIGTAPLLNYGVYPLLRKNGIKFGVASQITFGLFLSSCAGLGYTLLNWKAYELGPCGHYGTSSSCVDANGISLVSNISIWWMAIPYGLGGISELFVNIPAYGMAYSMAPKNMRGLVSALNLFAAAIAYAFGLMFASLIKDPYLTWDFGGPTIVGFVATVAFYFIYRDLDKEEFHLSENDDTRQTAKLQAEDKTLEAIRGQEGSLSEKSGHDEKSAVKNEI